MLCYHLQQLVAKLYVYLYLYNWLQCSVNSTLTYLAVL